MWSTFWTDLLVAVIGAILGSFFTVLIAWTTYCLQRRINEGHALRLLVDEIHRRRSFVPITNIRNVPGAGRSDDFYRVNSSVLDIRDRIRLTREQTRPESPAQRHLSDMTRDCNRYLEATARQPDRYMHDLMSLRNNLWEGIREIAVEIPHVPALEPGGGAC